MFVRVIHKKINTFMINTTALLIPVFLLIVCIEWFLNFVIRTRGIPLAMSS